MSACVPVIRLFVGAAAAAGLLGCPGCLFGERGFPLIEDRIVRPDPDELSCGGRKPTARQWAPEAQRELSGLLSPANRDALTTDDLRTGDGGALDVYAYYGINPRLLESVFGNFTGLRQTAAVLSGGHRGVPSAAAWPHFEPIEISMEDGVRLAARLSDAAGADPAKGFVVMSHGLFGNLAGRSPFDTADALRRFGFRVLAVEMRGHGDTFLRRPDVPLEWGIGESRDLIRISQLLRCEYGARRVGLLMVSQLAHHGLLSAWIDGRAPEPADAASPIFGSLPAPGPQPGFDGLVAVSPPVDLVGIADRQTRRESFLMRPVEASLQARVEERFKALGRPADWRFWDLIEYGMLRSRWAARYPDFCSLKHDGLDFLDFRRPDCGAAVRRMEAVRTPVLILHAANDPVASAQDIAELFARVRNPNIGVILLHGGGHCGFQALSPAYYYSLLAAFFDPATAPVPAPRARPGQGEPVAFGSQFLPR